MVFGKPLTSQAVIRSKLAAMISRVEASQNWLENITHQMNNVGLVYGLYSHSSLLTLLAC
jgi:alkylation response protein AidB-like acyl-CoA dehydrogenase